MHLNEADAGTSYRLSVCIGADTAVRTRTSRSFMKVNGGNSRPFRVDTHEVFSFEELNGNKTHDAWFRDGEWLHLKFNEDKVFYKSFSKVPHFCARGEITQAVAQANLK